MLTPLDPALLPHGANLFTRRQRGYRRREILQDTHPGPPAHPSPCQAPWGLWQGEEEHRAGRAQPHCHPVRWGQCNTPPTKASLLFPLLSLQVSIEARSGELPGETGKMQ